MKTKLLGWTLLFLLTLPAIALFGQEQATNHVADKFDPVQSGAVPADEAAAQFEATKAKAEKGDAMAQYNLGFCYANGDGVTKEYAEALKWYHKSADQGFKWAQLALSRMYYWGIGTTTNYDEALHWLFLAELNDNTGVAQYQAGRC